MNLSRISFFSIDYSNKYVFNNNNVITIIIMIFFYNIIKRIQDKWIDYVLFVKNKKYHFQHDT